MSSEPTTRDDASPYYIAGLAAQRGGKPLTDVPYLGGKRREDWLAGWLFAATEDNQHDR